MDWGCSAQYRFTIKQKFKKKEKKYTIPPFPGFFLCIHEPIKHTKMDNYELSNSLEVLPNCKLSATTKKLFITLREKSKTSQTDLQTVANAICKDLKVVNVIVAFGGVQSNTQVNGKLKSKTLGTYRPAMELINVFQFTAVRRNEIAPKTAFDTLLHELCHHFDYRLLSLQKSIHSAGFYKRISNLKTALLS